MRTLSIAGISLVALAAMTPAGAADRLIAAPAPIPIWSWTGFYVGSHIGQAWARNNWQSADGFFGPAGPFGTAFAPFAGSGASSGVFGGLQAGYNVQNGPIVWGLEIEGSTADLDGNARCAFALYLCNTRIDYMGTLTGRVGFAFDHALLYAKGGGAYAHDTYLMPPSTAARVFTADDNRFGWTVGVGVEYAFSPAWSTKLEFDYIDLGSRSTAFTDQAPFFDRSNIAIDQTLYRMKAGINYKADWSILGFSPASTHAFAAPAAIFAPATNGLGAAIPEWTIEAGARYWYSNGRFQKDLFDPSVTSQLDSRLSYNDMNGHAGEVFGRFDHRSGLLVKANLGLGDLVNGSLRDEDFPAFVFYSNTDSEMKDGRMRFGGADLGWNFLSTPSGKVGAYVGYRYFFERGNGFGCRQTAADLVCAPPIPSNFLALSETETWRGAAVGLNTQIQLTDRIRIEADGALLPYVSRYGFDNHWFRDNINPLAETGHGWGAQFEAVLSYALTPQWSVGVGGRYWYFTTTEAGVQFPGALQSPITFHTERYGGFLQASYKIDSGFGATPGAVAPAGFFKAPSLLAPAWNWTGLYLGGHVGGAWGRKEWSPNSGFFINPILAPFIGWGDVDGFIGGGQAGANYQIANWVVGVEGDVSWSDLDGYAPCARFFTCHTRADRLGTVAGRFGYARNNLLFYSKAGAAWVHDQHDVVFVEAPNVFTADVSRAGWMVGSGVEYGFTPNWSGKIEYNYLDFGTKSVAFADQFGNASSVDLKQTVQTVKLGVNYRYNWAAPAAVAPILAEPAAPAAHLASAPPLAPFTWTGLYLGLHAGAAHHDKDWSNPFGPQVFGDTIAGGGWLGGGQLGFNYQAGALVLGVEADASAARIDGANTCLVGLTPIGGVNCAATIDALGTIAGRIGYAFDRTLVYAKGGGAWVEDRFGLNLVGVGAGLYEVDSMRWGWTIGGGVEHALLANVTVKLEYNYLDLGSDSVVFSLPPAFAVASNLSIEQAAHVAKLGVNYLFSWGAPVVARY